MFSEKNKNQVSERNIISTNTSIVGNISSEGDFRIDGSVEGNIKTSGRVIIGAKGTVNGTIECTNADIEGSFSGKLFVTKLLSLKASAIVTGEVFTAKLLVEQNVTFNATCSMNSGIKELNKGGRKKIEKIA